MPKDATAPAAMRSVDRALSLLQHFSTQAPEIGLSDLARVANIDKTTTLRCLAALQRNGFVEQHPETKKYRLGFAPLHLAQVRERAFPLQTLVQPMLTRIVERVQETAHASILTQDHLVTIAVEAPSRATRVFLDPSEPVPLHATASGLAMLAALPTEALARLDLPADLPPFTAATPSSWSELEAELVQVRVEGLGRGKGTYEDDVVGTAAVFYGWSDRPIGTIAVAALGARYDAVLKTKIDTTLRAAAADLSRQMGA